MLPTPETMLWLSRIRLMPDWLRRTRRTNASSSNSASRGSRAMCAISAGSSAPPSETARPPNIRWSTNRSSRSGLPASRKRTRRLRSSGTPGGCTSIWPLMPRWPSRASPLSRASHRYLPRRWAAVNVCPESRPAKSSGPARWRRTGRGWRTSTEAIGRPRTWASRPTRTTSTSGSSGIAGRRTNHPGLDSVAGELAGSLVVGQLVAEGAVGGLRGLLLGLLLRAADAAAVQPGGDADTRGEGLNVVGAFVLDDVLGNAEVVQRAQFLQARLPVQAGAHRGRGLEHRVEEQVDDARGVLEAAAEVDGADQRLHRVGEDRGLLAATRGLLALAEADVHAEADRAGDVGQRAGVHDGGPQLGQAALREVAMGEVERLGDHHAEHRVAQELQALVGRQVAVLVGVRPVGQGKQQQLGVQDRIPERLTQLIGRVRPCCRWQPSARGQRT